MEICNTLQYERYCTRFFRLYKFKGLIFPLFFSFAFNLLNFLTYCFTLDACITLRWGITCLKIQQNLLLVFYAVINWRPHFGQWWDESRGKREHTQGLGWFRYLPLQCVFFTWISITINWLEEKLLFPWT